MKQTLTLREDDWNRDGGVYRSGPASGYMVDGMPDGTRARIANFGAPNGNNWRIMRINADNTQSDWKGHATARKRH